MQLQDVNKKKTGNDTWFKIIEAKVNECIALVIVDPTRAASTEASVIVPIMRRTVTRY